MQKYETIQKLSPTEFRRLTGVRKETFVQQKRYYSGKKKRHTLKSQVVVDKHSSLIICTNFCHGKKHDFKLFKDSKVRWVQKIQGVVDSGYTGIKKLQNTSLLPKKRSRGKVLTRDEKQMNRDISSKRALNEIEYCRGSGRIFYR